jgi:hypothetical protein
MILRVSYLTRKNSQHDQDVQKKEMTEVADFAAKKYDGKDRETIQEIQVRRTELRGSGCFQRSYHNTFAAAAPADWKAKSNLPRFLDPKNRQNP